MILKNIYFQLKITSRTPSLAYKLVNNMYFINLKLQYILNTFIQINLLFFRLIKLFVLYNFAYQYIINVYFYFHMFVLKVNF